MREKRLLRVPVAITAASIRLKGSLAQTFVIAMHQAKLMVGKGIAARIVGHKNNVATAWYRILF
jgi:hypothetical protein